MSNYTESIVGYDQLIQEVFIDPIRTVIVIDDEYPTLDSFAAKELNLEGAWKGKNQDVEHVRQLLEFARKKESPWLVDVHDGRKITVAKEEVFAPHLHHSDLLILDYNLEDSLGVKGEAAINILRKLAENDHFNLVIVHTKDDLEMVVREIALGLSYPDAALRLTEDEQESLNNALEQWENETEEIISLLDREISESTYLQVRTRNTEICAALLGTPEGSRIIDLWKSRPREVKINPRDLAKWLLLQKQGKLTKKFSSHDLGGVQVSNSGDINWIRTDRLFVTVLSKSHSPESFECKLLEAIRTSFPSPHRLLLAKMRTEIDQHGVIAEAAILRNKHIQVEWLSDFLEPDPVDQKGIIYNTIERHWEALGDQLQSTLSDFAERLYASFARLDTGEVISECGLDKTDVGSPDTLMSFNWFTSTKPIDRSHLTTGHVFNIIGQEEGLWICLSPACDMVPDRTLDSSLADCRPFIAVQLHRITRNNALRNATKNIYLFLQIGGNIEAFSIHKEGDIISNPEWKQMLAGNRGRFHEGTNLSVGWIDQKDGVLGLCWSEASALAQLRSEYALNLLQRIGIFLSRPGLGINFKALSG
ncbi:MAG TPA: response regulator receiver domain [Syntrophorhabdaceae bacterium]